MLPRPSANARLLCRVEVPHSVMRVTLQASYDGRAISSVSIRTYPRLASLYSLS
mgnify:CR=1